MNIIINCLCSLITSIITCLVIGNYFLDKNNEKWEEIFNEITKITIQEVRKIKK